MVVVNIVVIVVLSFSMGMNEKKVRYVGEIPS